MNPEAKQAAGIDARKWARDFNEMEVSKGLQPTNPELMVAWFANAIMAGYDTATAKLREELEECQRNRDWLQEQLAHQQPSPPPDGVAAATTAEESGIAVASRKAAERLLSEDEWQDGSIASVAGVIEATCSVVLCSFTQAILHGDEVHRLWLQEACDAFVSGKSMPPPRDAKGAKEAFDKLRSILKERSKGEVNTWGFVAMFMDMIDEAERAALTGTGEKKCVHPIPASGPAQCKEGHWLGSSEHPLEK